MTLAQMKYDGRVFTTEGNGQSHLSDNVVGNIKEWFLDCIYNATDATHQDRAKQLMNEAQLKFAMQETVYDLNDVEDLNQANTNYFGNDRKKLAPEIVI